MIFESVTLTPEGNLRATAKGHPTDVITAFHSVCCELLSPRGAWRITDVHGICLDEFNRDSDMEWTLHAHVKASHA